jgi:hypothetical protein
MQTPQELEKRKQSAMVFLSFSGCDSNYCENLLRSNLQIFAIKRRAKVPSAVA